MQWFMVQTRLNRPSAIRVAYFVNSTTCIHSAQKSYLVTLSSSSLQHLPTMPRSIYLSSPMVRPLSKIGLILTVLSFFKANAMPLNPQLGDLVQSLTTSTTFETLCPVRPVAPFPACRHLFAAGHVVPGLAPPPTDGSLLALSANSFQRTSLAPKRPLTFHSLTSHLQFCEMVPPPQSFPSVH